MSQRLTIPIKKAYKGMFDGPHATPQPSESGPVFLGIKNVGESGQLDLSDVRHISEEEYPRWIKRVEPRYGDIVFSYEATLNRYAIIPKGFRGCLGRRMALIRPDESKACGRFLYYYFFSNEWRKIIAQNTLIGSTVDRIPIAKFPDFPITIPSIPNQRKIAAILSAYDDLIENNLRRIKLLEDMAQNLYREWFVKFRFPGHKNTSFTDSPLGRIPEGGEVRLLNDVVDDIVDYRGKTPTKLNGEWAAEGIIALSALNVKGGRLVNLEKSRCISEDLYAHWMKKPLQRGDILMTSEAPLGELFFLCKEERYCLSQRLFSIRANRHVIAPILLYLCLESEQTQHELRSRASGATVSGIRQSELRNIPIFIPPRSIQDLAEPILMPLAELKAMLDESVTTLRRTRDLLLPKLLSGEVDVSDLDITIPEEAGA